VPPALRGHSVSLARSLACLLAACAQPSSILHFSSSSQARPARCASIPGSGCSLQGRNARASVVTTAGRYTRCYILQPGARPDPTSDDERMDDSTENAAAGPLGGREGGAAAGAATTNANGALDSVNGQGSAAAGAAPPTPVTPMPPSGAGGAAGAGSVNGAASSTLRHQQNGGSAQQQQQHGAGHDAANGSNGTISGKSV
jgi:hypothetical protein